VVTDKQVRRLIELLGKGKNLCTSAAKADMDEKTALKYRCLNKLLSEIKVDHTWRTWEDPFDAVWEELKGKLENQSGVRSEDIV